MSKLVKNKPENSEEKLQEQQQAVLDYVGDGGGELKGLFAELFSIGSFSPDLIANKNCENLVGSVEVPVGVAGPAKLSWQAVGGDSENSGANDWQRIELLLPLATTEGALVASINRGCKVLREAGNCKALVKTHGMTRAPAFAFSSISQAREFVAWLERPNTQRQVKIIAEKTSSHLTYLDSVSWQTGRVVFVRFRFNTDQAMGMNMVTVAVNQLWQELFSNQLGAQLLSISGNMCVDKKPSAINKIIGRGYEVQLETTLPTSLITNTLKTTPQKLFNTYYWKNVVGSNLAGSSSINMHAANAVAAIFLATGQDMAHISESAQADLLMEVEKTGLYVTIRLPNINVGTVGGGLGLPAFKQARALMKRDGESGLDISATELALAVGVAVLAGELSGLAALSSNQLAQAHEKLGRGKR